jgi:archaeal flagellar protein FlaI
VDGLEDALQRNPHLREYLDAWSQEGQAAPAYHAVLTSELKNVRPLNILYPVGDPVFIHVVQGPDDLVATYRVIEPVLPPQDAPAYDALRMEAFLHAPEVPVPETWTEGDPSLKALLDRILSGRSLTTVKDGRRIRFRLSKSLDERLRYRLMRDVAGYGPIESILRDTWIEDVNCTGLTDLHVVHKLFGMVRTSVRFSAAPELNAFLESLGERMGRSVSASNPIVDGALPNGNRINIVYGEDISKGGSSFTIRKQAETPVPITQLVSWNTMDAQLAAYLWLCVENGMNFFVSGETASGKTTTLNASLAFIPPKNKIITAEDTPEVHLPHENWQQLVTRDRGAKDSRVNMNELLKAALRSRPNYIVVGEIRGAEGSVAFQAMQAGHSTMATFHASSVAKLVQRFSSQPINVPPQFMNNLNVVLIQSAVYLKGRILRRVLAVEEIEGYSKRAGAVITRQVFHWDPVHDRYMFSGRNNSYVLENLIAPRMRMRDPRQVYAELDRRTRVVRDLVARSEFDYPRVAQFFFAQAEARGQTPTEPEVPAR